MGRSIGIGIGKYRLKFMDQYRDRLKFWYRPISTIHFLYILTSVPIKIASHTIFQQNIEGIKH